MQLILLNFILIFYNINFIRYNYINYIKSFFMIIYNLNINYFLKLEYAKNYKFICLILLPKIMKEEIL